MSLNPNPNATQAFIKRFFTVYKPDPKDASKMIGVDMIEYGPLASVDRTSIISTVLSLKRVNHGDTSGNPAVDMANERWAFIEPRYNAWKEGQEFPDTGTPLGAWNGVAPELAESLRARGVRTVEAVAAMTEAQVERFGVPGLRDLIRGAKMFLEAADQNRFAAELAKTKDDAAGRDLVIAEQREAIAAQQKQIEEMRALVTELAGKRGPGRPSNAEKAAREQAEAEAAA